MVAIFLLILLLERAKSLRFLGKASLPHLKSINKAIASNAQAIKLDSFLKGGLRQPGDSPFAFPPLPDTLTAPLQEKIGEVAKLLKPGEGQLQNAKFHEMGAVRGMEDPMMWTHVFFAIGAAIAAIHGLWDMAILTTIVLPLSLAYHRSYEKPGLLTNVEGVAAKALFLYGVLQLTNCPSHGTFLVECALLVSTMTVFIATNLNKKLYEPWHALMHFIPPVWGTFVAVNHTPLVPISLSVPF